MTTNYLSDSTPVRCGLKLSTLESVLLEYHRDHGTTEARGMSVHMVHDRLIREYGRCKSRKAVREAMEGEFVLP